MLRELSQRLFVLRYPYKDILDRQRATGLLYILVFTFVLGIGLVVLNVVPDIQRGLEFDAIDYFIIALPVTMLILHTLVQRGYYRSSAILMVVVVFLIALPDIEQEGLTFFNITGILSGMILCGTLLGWRSLTSYTILSILVFAQLTFFGNEANSLNFSQFLIITQLFAIIAFILFIFGTNIRINADRIIRNLRQTETLAPSLTNLSRRSEMADEDSISSALVNIARDDLGYNFAQLFLTDENGKINTRATVSLNRAQLNTEGDIDLPESSAIQQAARNQAPIVVNMNSPEIAREHLLPGIVSGLAMPIMANDVLIGVLDVQREDARSFTEREIKNVQLLADQAATVMQQTRRDAQIQEELDAQRLLIQRQQNRLRDFEALEQRTTFNSWETYLRQRDLEFLGFDFNSEDVESLTIASNMPQDLRDSLTLDDVQLVVEGDDQFVHAPILLRGQSLGAMTFRVPVKQQRIAPRQLELIRSVVQRLALALENKRLFEQSQSQAQRERQANEVGNLLLSTTDIETVLNLAAENFNEALGAVQTRLQIQVGNDAQDGRSNGNGS